MEMEMKYLRIILVLTFLCLPDVRSATCSWDGAILSDDKCYFYYRTAQLSFSDAESACGSKGGVLAKLSNFMLVYEIAVDLTSGSAWLGANDKQKEGTWVWEDGSDAAKLWEYNQPQNSSSSDDCAVVQAALGGRLNAADISCDTTLNFYCMTEAIDPTTTTEITTSTQATSQSSGSTILTSASTEKVQVTTMMKSGADFIDSNVIFAFTLCAFIHLTI